MHIKETEEECHKVEMTLSEEVTFLNKGAILQELNNLPNGTEITIDIRNSVRVDYDVYEIIDNFRKNSAVDREIEVIIKSDTKYNTADY
jgi:MFS superfamily sulfate permease-like transporter